jgi:hypothetical protein
MSFPVFDPPVVFLRRENPYVDLPRVPTPFLPPSKGGTGVTLCLCQGPTVYGGEVLERFIVASVHAGEAEVLHAVAGWAERDEPIQTLDVAFVVV